MLSGLKREGEGRSTTRLLEEGDTKGKDADVLRIAVREQQMKEDQTGIHFIGEKEADEPSRER